MILFIIDNAIPNIAYPLLDQNRTNIARLLAHGINRTFYTIGTRVQNVFESILISAFLLFCGSVLADDQVTKRVAGLDLSQGNSLQMQLCSLKPGKKMKDYKANFDAYVDWSKKQGVETFALRLTPMYHSQPNNQSGYEWIELLAAPF